MHKEDGRMLLLAFTAAWFKNAVVAAKDNLFLLLVSIQYAHHSLLGVTLTTPLNDCKLLMSH